MAGRVGAYLTMYADQRDWVITPEGCPAMDEHRKAAAAGEEDLQPVCEKYNPIYGRRKCVYLYGTALRENACDRIDGSVMWQNAIGAGRSQMRCSVLCLAARRNRPPGV